jgi:hypothetical protein
MGDVSALVESVERLADRFRAMPQSRLLGAVPGYPSRAAAGLALARGLARDAQLLEEGPRAVPREIPEAGVFAVGDQLAVAVHDFAAVLGAGRSGNDDTAAAGLLAEATAAVSAVTELCS